VKSLLLALVLALLSFQANADISQTFTVEVERDERTEFEVEQIARGRVLVEAADKLPSLLLGEEKLVTNDGHVSSYSQQIKAVLVGQANLQVIETSWNSDRTRFEMTASVTLDYADSLNRIAGIKSNLDAQNAMAKAYQDLVNALSEGSSKGFSLSASLARIDRVLLNHFNALGYENSIALQRQIAEHEATVNSLEAYYDVYLPMWNSINFEVVDVDVGVIVVDINADEAYSRQVSQSGLLDLCIGRADFHRSHRHLAGSSLIKLPARLIVSNSVEGETLPSHQYFAAWQDGRPLRFSPGAVSLFQTHRAQGSKPANGYRVTTSELGYSLDDLVRSPDTLLSMIGLC